MLLFLLTRIALADPTVSATLASDGHYTLRIVSDRAWGSAELKVMGGETTDLGPIKVDEVVLVEGWTDEQRSLRISLAAACADGRGRTWMFEVDPFRVPAKVPDLTRKRRAWPFGGRR